MLRDDDPFTPLLQQFLNTNYETGTRLSENEDGPKPENPLIFFNRHIDSTLLLKRIKRAPWIPKELGEICENAIKEFTDAGHTFVQNFEYTERFQSYPTDGNSCRDVAEYHFKRIANPCNAYASKLLFHPNDPAWFSFIASRRTWSTDIDYVFCSSGDAAIIKPKGADIGDREYDIPPQTRSTLDTWVLPTINKLRDLKSIFDYEFFIKTKKAETLLGKMNSCTQFKWEIPTVRGSLGLPESSPPPDLPIIQSLFPSLGNVTHRTLPSRKEATSAKAATKKRKLVAPLQNTQKREAQYRMNVDHYIQKVRSEQLSCAS